MSTGQGMKKLFSIRQQFHGNGPVIFAWQPRGNFFASVGDGQKNMYLFDRRGVQTDEISLLSNNKVLHLEWDRDGEILAVLQKGESYVQLWHLAKKSMEILETNSKDCSWIGWSKVGPQLAVGSARGNLLIYNKRTLKKEPVVGKHTKKITCGAWSASNRLALGAEDKLVSVSSAEGDMIDQTMIKSDPTMLKFANEHNPKNPNMISLVVGGVKLLLHSGTSQSAMPVELAFQQKYGVIREYAWFGQGYLFVGFETGYMVIISSDTGDVIDELFSFRFHHNGLDMFCVHHDLQRCATAGDGMVKLINMKDKFREWKESKSDRTYISSEVAKVCQMHWSDDGQLFTVATENGQINCYLTKVQALAASHQTRLAYLTSLREMTIVDATMESEQRVVIQTDIEPSFVALGPEHCAAGMNNRIWFHSAMHSGDTRDTLRNEEEYVGTVESCSLNATSAAVLVEGRVFLHPIERGWGGDPSGRDATVVYPKKEDGAAITCAVLAGPYLIYADVQGHLIYALDGAIVNEFHHGETIRKIFPNPSGTRVVLFDSTSAAFLYNPVNDDLLPVPLSASVERVLWDVMDPSVFVSVEPQQLTTYLYVQTAVAGSIVKELGNLSLSEEAELVIEPSPTSYVHGLNPVLIADGRCICQQSTGDLKDPPIRLKSHEACVKPKDGEDDKSMDKKYAFMQNVALNRFGPAFQIAHELGDSECWKALGRRALECLDLSAAKKAYRQVPVPGLVQWIERFQTVEEKQLLSAHIAALFGFFPEAQALFLSSCNPEAALDMHCDLMEWDQALQLCQTLTPHRLPDILLQSALQLESRQQTARAQQYFQQALYEECRSEQERSHNRQCQEGLARTCIRLGDLVRGVPLAKQLAEQGFPQVCKDCAQALEGMKQFQEAAELHECAGSFEKAASLYIMDLNFDQAAPLMRKIKSSKLQLQYAKAKESRHAYADAKEAYEAAGDGEAVIRLQLYHLKQVDQALNQVRKTKDPASALLCAEYCQTSGRWGGAVEFLLLAKSSDQAFRLAEEHDQMDVYEHALGTGTPEQHLLIAKHYERRNLLGKAGEQYAKCGTADAYQTALRFFLKVGESEIDNAISVVGKAQNDILTNQLIDYLMGESDHVPKDPHYVYRLHKALGNYGQAAQTALLIAKQEQDMGNYKIAHDLLLQTHRDLEGEHMAIPQELSKQLLLLHSYTLVRKLVKEGNHLNAAHMLCRVAESIGQFPSHAVPILTSTVIECQRAGLKAEAYKYACELMKPQFRSEIQEAYKKKIEHVVRREKKPDEIMPNQTPCPFCDTQVTETELFCYNCKNIIPYCAASGYHMERNNWHQCSACNFPSRFTLAKESAETGCAMCGDVQPAVKVLDFRELPKYRKVE